MRTQDRVGAALLEVLAALAILSTAILVLLATALAAGEAITRGRAADHELARASAFLDAVALWTREDLDRRLGSRRQGPWRLAVERFHPELYVVVLEDSLGRSELLRTSLYRPRQHVAID